MEVITQQEDIADGNIWYFVSYTLDTVTIEGWINRSAAGNALIENTPCPDAP
ncbi:MAG: hypothetical protein HC915_13350 [Anaerolineae bacterium]|nr:hypothetical protein [Anaerolineae bacterium]